jgi:squalene-hopene/tetraprenyl-beta-curcumene cyclase
MMIEELLRRQNHDGGWGTCPNAVSKSSFSSPDVTGAVLESLRNCQAPAVAATREHAVAYLRSTQRADGRWASTTATGWIHGTSLAVRGLLSAGIANDDDAVAAGLNWLLVHQNANGSWGESATENHVSQEPFDAESLHNNSPAPATAYPTAWALMALVAAGKAAHPAARRAVEFLLKTQEVDGGWNEPQLILRDAVANRWYCNNLQTVAWPLLALSRWIVAAASSQSSPADDMSLRLVAAEM